MTLNERIRQIWKESGLTMEKFGSRIGITTSSVSTMVNGKSNPSDQSIRSICREFGIREEWLRAGKEPMKAEQSRFDELESFVADLKTQNPDFRHRFLTLLAKFSPEQWALLEEMALSLSEGTQEKVPPSQQTRFTLPERKNVHDWTDAEMHAELQRQLDAEKRETDESSTSFSGNSGAATA